MGIDISLGPDASYQQLRNCSRFQIAQLLWPERFGQNSVRWDLRWTCQEREEFLNEVNEAVRKRERARKRTANWSRRRVLLMCCSRKWNGQGDYHFVHRLMVENYDLLRHLM